MTTLLTYQGGKGTQSRGTEKLQSYQYPTLTDSLHTPPTQICDPSTDKY